MSQKKESNSDPWLLGPGRTRRRTKRQNRRLKKSRTIKKMAIRMTVTPRPRSLLQLPRQHSLLPQRRHSLSPKLTKM